MRAALKDSIAIAAALLAGAGLGSPRPCAAEAAAGLPAWVQEVSLAGFLSTSWSYNFNRPPSGTNAFRVFDFDDDTFKLDVFELVAQKAAAKPGESGFRVDVAMGSSVPRVSAAAGLFRDALGVAQDIDLQQAFASWVAPAGSGLRLDVGKFVTHLGYEVIEGYDGWNDHATRSFLFGYSIPFTHVGVRAGYTFTPRVSALVMVVNGWDVARDNNRQPSVGGQLTLLPAAPLTVILNGMVGPEKSGDVHDLRTILDLVAIWKASDRVTLGLNADHGIEEGDLPVIDPPAPSAHWDGTALYARATFARGFALSVRAEHFEDLDGVRTGFAQKLNEFTVTPEKRLTPHLLVRADLRLDRSNLEVFEKDSGAFSKHQTTVLIGSIYSF